MLGPALHAESAQCFKRASHLEAAQRDEVWPQQPAELGSLIHSSHTSPWIQLLESRAAPRGLPSAPHPAEIEWGTLQMAGKGLQEPVVARRWVGYATGGQSKVGGGRSLR